MNLYLIRRMTDHIGWDEYDAKVAQANDETQAREVASLRVGDEGNVWTNPDYTLVTLIGIAREGEVQPMVILESFNAG